MWGMRFVCALVYVCAGVSMCVCLHVCVVAEPRKQKSFTGADVHWLWSVSVWPPLHLHPLHCCGVSHKYHRAHPLKRRG